MRGTRNPWNGTVAVAGGKGGCGKTTTVLGLAAALVERGYRPLAVDADVDVPDLHIRAGVDREPGLPALPSGVHPAAASQESAEVPGVSVLAAGTGEVDVGRALRRVAGARRPVLLDCPAGAGPDAAEPLRVADATVVVGTTTAAGRTDAEKSAGMARRLGAPPVAWVERTVASGVPMGTSHPTDLPRVDVPDVGREPLESDPVRAAYRAVVRRVDVGRPPDARRRREPHAREYGRNL